MCVSAGGCTLYVCLESYKCNVRFYVLAHITLNHNCTSESCCPDSQVQHVGVVCCQG